MGLVLRTQRFGEQPKPQRRSHGFLAHRGAPIAQKVNTGPVQTMCRGKVRARPGARIFIFRSLIRLPGLFPVRAQGRARPPLGPCRAGGAVEPRALDVGRRRDFRHAVFVVLELAGEDLHRHAAEVVFTLIDMLEPKVLPVLLKNPTP